MNNEDRILNKLDDIIETGNKNHGVVIERLTIQETLMQTLVGEGGKIQILEAKADKHGSFITKAKAILGLISFVGLGGLVDAITHHLGRKP